MPYSNGGGLPPRYPPYPGGTPGGGGSGGGGGSSGGGGGTSGPTSYIPLSNGGVFARSKAALFPVYNAADARCEFMAFDPTQVNDDQANASFYAFRVEEITPYRTPSIKRVIISYRDLGQVTITVTLAGCNDNQEVVSRNKTAILGNKDPTGKILTQKVDIFLSAMDQQLSISRAAGAGPLAITKVWPVVAVEDVKL